MQDADGGQAPVRERTVIVDAVEITAGGGLVPRAQLLGGERVALLVWIGRRGRHARGTPVLIGGAKGLEALGYLPLRWGENNIDVLLELSVAISAPLVASVASVSAGLDPDFDAVRHFLGDGALHVAVDTENSFLPTGCYSNKRSNGIASSRTRLHCTSLVIASSPFSERLKNCSGPGA